MRAQVGRLANGRLHLHDGPIDLIIGCDGKRENVGAAEQAAIRRFATILDELCAELPLLRRRTGGGDGDGSRLAASPHPFLLPTGEKGRLNRERVACVPSPQSGEGQGEGAKVGATLSVQHERPAGVVADRMWRATLPFAREAFITPMAAVAGAVAEEIVEAMTVAAPLARCMVNNGGDIAFFLAPGERIRLGLIDRPDRPTQFAGTVIGSDQPVRGVATSGWRGRSFSLGIADAVTVLAANASAADAAATLIANAVDLPGHPAIKRQRAVALQPDSDLGNRLVTTDVGDLPVYAVASALEAGVQQARNFLARGWIAGCALHLHGATRIVEVEPAELGIAHA